MKIRINARFQDKNNNLIWYIKAKPPRFYGAALLFALRFYKKYYKHMFAFYLTSVVMS